MGLSKSRFSYKKLYLYIGLIIATLCLSQCAKPPKITQNACQILKEKNGWFSSWSKASQSASIRYNIPASIILATIYAESGFKANAKPPRTKLLGFIPWKRPSSAYGYAQAVNATWKAYSMETGSSSVKRNSFKDSVHFIGWYYDKIAKQQHISRHDAYSLYVYYHLGANYRGSLQNAPSLVKRQATVVANMSRQYAKQLAACKYW